MVTVRGESQGQCKKCRNLRDRVRPYVNGEKSCSHLRQLYELNLEIIVALKPGAYILKFPPTQEHEDQLIFTKDNAIIRTRYRCISLSYDVKAIAEQLTRMNRQVTTTTASLTDNAGEPINSAQYLKQVADKRIQEEDEEFF